MRKGDLVKLIVDGEIHEGTVTQISDEWAWVKIPFYYSLSVKHGKPMTPNELIVKERTDLIMI
jgi:hypothetical protein